MNLHTKSCVQGRPFIQVARVCRCQGLEFKNYENRARNKCVRTKRMPERLAWEMSMVYTTPSNVLWRTIACRWRMLREVSDGWSFLISLDLQMCHPLDLQRCHPCMDVECCYTCIKKHSQESEHFFLPEAQHITMHIQQIKSMRNGSRFFVLEAVIEPDSKPNLWWND